jgi:hypothetical protein
MPTIIGFRAGWESSKVIRMSLCDESIGDVFFIIFGIIVLVNLGLLLEEST